MPAFEEIATSFWDDDDRGGHPPLSDQAVAHAEDLLGVRLPADLLHLLRLRNGGCVSPRYGRYPTSVPTSWADDHVPFETLMGIGDTEGRLSILDTPYLVDEWELPRPVVLLTGDGHWWIALDYRAGRPEPSVTWLDADRQTELALATDFRSFVTGLRP